MVLLPQDEASVLQHLRSFKGLPFTNADPAAEPAQQPLSRSLAAAEEGFDWDAPAVDKATEVIPSTAAPCGKQAPALTSLAACAGQIC